ncbi:ArsR/SmtB family transcription factor [Candidatus Neomarinimicrobiota bacterium]
MRNSVILFKALADTSRVRIIKMLEVKSLCVCELTEILQLATSTVSKHLSILKNAGLVIDIKDGRWVNYQLNRREKPDLIRDTINLINKSSDSSAIFKADTGQVRTVDRDIICRI